MKKSKVIRKITKLCKEWQGSQLDAQFAREMLQLLEGEGMLPPFSKQADYNCECGCNGRCPKGHEWDNENWPAGANQVEVVYRR